MDGGIFLLQFSHFLSEVQYMKIWEFFFQPPLVLCHAVPVPPRLAAFTVTTTKSFWDLTQYLLLPQGYVFLDEYDPSEYDPFFQKTCTDSWKVRGGLESHFDQQEVNRVCSWCAAGGCSRGAHLSFINSPLLHLSLRVVWTWFPPVTQPVSILSPVFEAQ